MPGENIQDWSTSATSNGNADTSINWAEGQPRASVNNSARSMMAAHAKQRNLLNGSIVTGGTTNAQMFFSGLDYATVPTGLVVKLLVGPTLTNTGPATLNMDNIGAVAIKTPLGADVSPGALTAGSYVELLYNGTNWILVINHLAALGFGLTNVRVVLTDGFYPSTSALAPVLVMLKGGGGGGGGGDGSVTEGFGGGGGEGATSFKLVTASAISGQGITIGGGGLGGNAAAGLDGNPSSVGVLVTAPGGFGGQAAEAGGLAGYGGSGGICDFSIPGAPGQGGYFDTIVFTSGGGAGGGATRGPARTNSGGGGAGSDYTDAGGNGGSGIAVFFEFGPL